MTNNSLSTCVDLLRTESAASSQRAVAKRLRISPATICRLLSGTYPHPERMVTHITAAFGLVGCPAVQQMITRIECAQAANGQAPTHNPMKMDAWRKCRQCQNNCKKGD